MGRRREKGEMKLIEERREENIGRKERKIKLDRKKKERGKKNKRDEGEKKLLDERKEEIGERDETRKKKLIEGRGKEEMGGKKERWKPG